MGLAFGGGKSLGQLAIPLPGWPALIYTLTILPPPCRSLVCASLLTAMAGLLAMKPELLGKLAEDSSFWTMESPLDSPYNGNGNGTGSHYLHKFARSYRHRPTNGKVVQQGTETLEDNQAVTDAFTSDGSSGIAIPSRDAEDADVESQKSPSSLSSDPSELSLKVQLLESLITDMFTTVSSLKNAYMELQSAHVPYDPDKLQVADRAVIAELRRLSELKHSYRETMVPATSVEVQDESTLRLEIENKEAILKSYEGIISNFHSEIQKKNVVVENLKDTLAQTTLKKEKLERRVRRLEQRLARDSAVNSSSGVSPTTQLLESAVLGASEAARSFTKLLISLMKTAQWDLDAAANSIQPDVNYVRSTYKKFAFESYVCHCMLNGFESENFYLSGSLSSILDAQKNRQECFIEFQDLRTADPVEVISNRPDSMFGRYCLKKFLDLIHPKMEESFFGNSEQRKQVLNGHHPDSQFYQSFLKLAKAMWLLHRLAFSFEPNVRIFQVKQNTDFSPLYMESIVQMVELDVSTPGVRPRVGFTVMPGFRVEKTIIKCQVYITTVVSNVSAQGQIP